MHELYPFMITITEDVSNSLPLPHPYKILFKSQHLTRIHWVHNKDPKCLPFTAHGHSVVTCLIFSHGHIISASDDHSIHAYSPITGEQLMSLNGHEGCVFGEPPRRGGGATSSKATHARPLPLNDEMPTRPQIQIAGSTYVRCANPLGVDM